MTQLNESAAQGRYKSVPPDADRAVARVVSASELNPVARNFGEKRMSLGTILLIVLILMLIGAIPTWPHSRGWGYGPSGGLGLVVIVIVVLLLIGRL